VRRSGGVATRVSGAVRQGERGAAETRGGPGRNRRRARRCVRGARQSRGGAAKSPRGLAWILATVAQGGARADDAAVVARLGPGRARCGTGGFGSGQRAPRSSMRRRTRSPKRAREEEPVSRNNKVQSSCTKRRPRLGTGGSRSGQRVADRESRGRIPSSRWRSSLPRRGAGRERSRSTGRGHHA